MKRRTNELGTLAGFVKSSHFFFNALFGRGYGDGLISAIAVCEMVDRAPGKSMANLKNALPKNQVLADHVVALPRPRPNTAPSMMW